jgi:hypothetical protein
MHTHSHICTHIHTQIHKHTHTHTHTHTHSQTYTHIDIDKQVQKMLVMLCMQFVTKRSGRRIAHPQLMSSVTVLVVCSVALSSNSKHSSCVREVQRARHKLPVSTPAACGWTGDISAAPSPAPARAPALPQESGCVCDCATVSAYKFVSA